MSFQWPSAHSRLERNFFVAHSSHDNQPFPELVHSKRKLNAHGLHTQVIDKSPSLYLGASQQTIFPDNSGTQGGLSTEGGTT
jgi:hypothetical protein